jgi:hypothetical protein
MLPQGQLLKCRFCLFGSISEIIDDLKSHTEQVISLKKKKMARTKTVKTEIG